MTPGRGIGRIEALVSGPAVLALFAWFALTACDEFSGPPDPPTPGPDAVYGDIPVHESADGGMTIASIHCDSNGKYLGGGNPVEEDQAKRALDEAIEKAKQEIKAIDNQLDRCKATKKKTSADYQAEYGCRDDELYKSQTVFFDAKAAQRKADENLTHLKSTRYSMGVSLGESQKSIEFLESPTAMLGDVIGPLAGLDPLIKDKAAAAKAARRDAALLKRDIAEVERQLPAAEAELVEANRRAAEARGPYEDMSARCDRARKASMTEPCSQFTLDGLNAHRSVLRDQAAMHAHRKDRFDKCIDDRKRQAKAQQERARPAIDPGFILNQPGLFRPSPRPSKPAPSQPSQPHKE